MIDMPGACPQPRDARCGCLTFATAAGLSAADAAGFVAATAGVSLRRGE